jgi:hypothetical protein
MKPKIPWVGFNSLCEDIRICNYHFNVLQVNVDTLLYMTMWFTEYLCIPATGGFEPQSPRTHPSPSNVCQLIILYMALFL